MSRLAPRGPRLWLWLGPRLWLALGPRLWLALGFGFGLGLAPAATGCSAPAPGAPLAPDRALASPPDLAPEAPRAPDQRRDLPGPDLGKGPPYPLILVHGFFGFEKVGPLDYFYKVRPALEAAGHQVFVTKVNPFASVSTRGEQLLTQVQAILIESGAAKVNLIAHSQGGLDARYVAARLPTRIGALLTIATPHLGDELADTLLGKAPGFSLALAEGFCALLGRTFYGDVGKDPDLKASLESLSTDAAAVFNASYPDPPEVHVYSVGGRSNLALAEAECFAPKAPPFIAKYQKVKDPIDPLLLLSAQVLGGSLLDPAPNDGIVRTSSTKWGTWLGCIPADHMDEVGQLLGDSPGLGNSFDYVAFYKDLGRFLVDQGF